MIEIGDHITALLTSKADMLLEYFSIKINDDGGLASLGVLLPDYDPPMHKLPQFIFQLATLVHTY